MCLIGKTQLLCMQCRGIGPHLAVRGRSHGFSRVATGTWVIFSSYSWDDPSKLLFVQRRLDSSLVMRDTSGISWMLGREIEMLLDGRHETNSTFLVTTVILGFLSIFNKSQASSHFEALNSACLSRCQRDIRPPVHMRWEPRLSLVSPQGNQTYLHLVK